MIDFPCPSCATLISLEGEGTSVCPKCGKPVVLKFELPLTVAPAAVSQKASQSPPPSKPATAGQIILGCVAGLLLLGWVVNLFNPYGGTSSNPLTKSSATLTDWSKASVFERNDFVESAIDSYQRAHGRVANRSECVSGLKMVLDSSASSRPSNNLKKEAADWLGIFNIQFPR